MNKLSRLILMLIVFNSCSSPKVTQEEMNETMNKAHFDKQVFQEMKKYENLKTFLEKNIDTIIDFRYHKNIVRHVRGEAKPDSVYLGNDDCYSFFQGNDQYDITNVPDYLKRELDSLFNTFSKKENLSFRVCKDKMITIEFKQERFENNLALLHTLIWNNSDLTIRTYEKDTLLSNKFIYKIRLTELGR